MITDKPLYILANRIRQCVKSTMYSLLSRFYSRNAMVSVGNLSTFMEISRLRKPDDFGERQRHILVYIRGTEVLCLRPQTVLCFQISE